MRISFCLTILVLALGSASARADQFVIMLRPNVPPPACTGEQSGIWHNYQCQSFAYVFNKRTTEFYKCQADVAVSVNTQSQILGEHSMKVECVKLGQVPNLPRADYSVVADWRYMTGTGNNPEAGVFIWISQDDKLNVHACVSLTYALGTHFECSQAQFGSQHQKE